MVWEDQTPDKILTPAAFDNAIRVHMALGGSTNAIIHVIAMARRVGVPLDMARFDAISRQVPVIANITPSGKYLMEDFFYAGGLRALMGRCRTCSICPAMTVNGRTARREYRRRARSIYPTSSIAERPLYPRGTRADRQSGAARRVMKPAAADQRCCAHRGKALAFRNYDAMAPRGRPRRSRCHARPVLVSKTPAQKAARACPNGAMPIPKKLLKAGCATCCASPTRA